MEVSRVRALRGPNRWSQRTAIEAIVECSPAESSAKAIKAIASVLNSQFPELDSPRNLAHALAATALHLQIRAGCDVSFLHVATTSDRQTHQVVIEYREEAVGVLAE